MSHEVPTRPGCCREVKESTLLKNKSVSVLSVFYFYFHLRLF